MIVDAQVEASDIYVGTFKDCHDAYLVTNSICRNDTVGRAGNYHCKVKAVKNGKSFHIDYFFYADSEGWHYENSQGFKGIVSPSKSPVTQKILDTVIENKNMGIANIPASRIALGNIHYGTWFEDVIRMYGRPTHKSSDGYTSYWGDKFEIFDANPGTVIRNITTKSADGLKTPDGVGVGMSANVLTNVYGRANLVSQDSSGHTVYVYPTSSVCLSFLVSGGIIREISIYLRT